MKSILIACMMFACLSTATANGDFSHNSLEGVWFASASSFNNRIYAVGLFQEKGKDKPQHAFLISYDASGKEIWREQDPSLKEHKALYVSPDAVYAGGDGLSKYSYDGKLIWRKKNPLNALTGDHHSVYTAYASTIKKYNAAGDEIWSTAAKLEKKGKASFNALALADEFIYAAGQKGNNAYLSKFSVADGQEVWSKSYKAKEFNGIAIDRHKNIYLAGQKDCSGEEMEFTCQAMVVMLDASGYVMWEKVYPENVAYQLESIMVNETGVYAAGYLRSQSEERFDHSIHRGALVKHSLDGALQWSAPGRLTSEFSVVFSDGKHIYAGGKEFSAFHFYSSGEPGKSMLDKYDVKAAYHGVPVYEKSPLTYQLQLFSSKDPDKAGMEAAKIKMDFPDTHMVIVEQEGKETLYRVRCRSSEDVWDVEEPITIKMLEERNLKPMMTKN